MPGPTAATARGTLYVVATPIGNLEDITLRALRILKSVSIVAAEDTRRTAFFLRHYDIGTPMLSVHEHNEGQRAAPIIGRLAAGESVALVTDAGTPAVSDPGAHLVSAVRSAGYVVEPIPGPSAVLAALSASGLVSDGFTFAGFTPNKANARKKWLQELVVESKRRPVVIFEAPHRLHSTLTDLSILGKRQIIGCRELTKIHEEIQFGSPSELATRFSVPKGEFTLILPKEPDSDPAVEMVGDAEIVAEFGRITDNLLVGSRREAMRRVAEKLGVSVKAVYESIERTKIG